MRRCLAVAAVALAVAGCGADRNDQRPAPGSSPSVEPAASGPATDASGPATEPPPASFQPLPEPVVPPMSPDPTTEPTVVDHTLNAAPAAP